MRVLREAVRAEVQSAPAHPGAHARSAVPLHLLRQTIRAEEQSAAPSQSSRGISAATAEW